MNSYRLVLILLSTLSLMLPVTSRASGNIFADATAFTTYGSVARNTEMNFTDFSVGYNWFMIFFGFGLSFEKRVSIDNTGGERAGAKIYLGTDLNC